MAAKKNTVKEEAPVAVEIETSTADTEAVDVNIETGQDATAYMRELVPFYAFKDDDKYKDDITVGVNGRVFRIKRGVEVMIPRYVYNVLVRGMNQDTKTADLINAQADAYAEAARRLNV